MVGFAGPDVRLLVRCQNLLMYSSLLVRRINGISRLTSSDKTYKYADVYDIPMTKYDCEMSKYLKAYFRANVKKDDVLNTEEIMGIIRQKYKRNVPTKKWMGQFIDFYLHDTLECVEEYNRKGGRTFKNILGDSYGEQFKRKIIDGEVRYVFKDEFESMKGDGMRW